MKKTVYSFVRMERIVVQRYDIEWKDEDEIQETLWDIEEWRYKYEPDHNFHYEPEEIMHKLWFDMSEVFEDDIEDEDKLTENLNEFLEW